MFNALSGMGNGGQVETKPPTMPTQLCTQPLPFLLFGWWNIQHSWTLKDPFRMLFNLCLYAGSLLYYNRTHKQGFGIGAGGLLGISGGLLWAAQGAIMTSYPPHDRKWTYFSTFWSIFNLGGVIGGLIPFMLNYNRTTTVFVNDG